jgi:hypothetical protein
MTGQLALDLTLPTDAVTVEQVAVVFTALGGPNAGELTYATGDPDWLRFMAETWLPARAAELGRACDARLMRREIRCGEWEPM